MIFIKPVTWAELADLERLFEGKGGPHYCWCSLWRKNGGSRLKKKEEKKNCLLRDVQDGVQVGLLAYEREEPIAWCSVGPRETFRKLGGHPGVDNVWSIVCFFVRRSHRRKGIAQKLLEEAIDFARKREAKYLEAYAAAADTTSYRFMGYVPMFEQAGFTFVKMAGKRRHVMLKRL